MQLLVCWLDYSYCFCYFWLFGGKLEFFEYLSAEDILTIILIDLEWSDRPDNLFFSCCKRRKNRFEPTYLRPKEVAPLPREPSPVPVATSSSSSSSQSPSPSPPPRTPTPEPIKEPSPIPSSSSSSSSERTPTPKPRTPSPLHVSWTMVNYKFYSENYKIFNLRMIQFTRFPPEVQPMTHLHPMMDNMFKWKMKHLVMFQRLSSDLLTQQTTKKSLQLLLLLIPIKFRKH